MHVRYRSARCRATSRPSSVSDRQLHPARAAQGSRAQGLSHVLGALEPLSPRRTRPGISATALTPVLYANRATFFSVPPPLEGCRTTPTGGASDGPRESIGGGEPWRSGSGDGELGS